MPEVLGVPKVKLNVELDRPHTWHVACSTLLWLNGSADRRSMDQFIILALLLGSLLTTLVAAKGMLGLLFHLMTLGRQGERLAASSQRTSASL